MTENSWVVPPPAPQPHARRGRAGMAAVGALVGVVAGVAITWSVVSANAASSTSGAAGTPATAAASAPAAPPGLRDHGAGLGSKGTVTAVGAASVSIKTSAGTKTYKVTSSSDIDKNGEAKLSDLKVGDAVTFDTESVAGSTVIDHLHAGNEALDRPTRPTG